MTAAADTSKKKKSSSKGTRSLLIILILLVLAGLGLGAWYVFSSQQDDGPQLPPPASYVQLAPAFVVNLDEADGGVRYLQVEVDLVTREPGAVELLQHHAPALRARLLMLFAQQTYDGLATRAGKEALQARALEEVRELMLAETGAPQAEALLFTSFVTQ